MTAKGAKTGNRLQIAARFDKPLWDQMGLVCLKKSWSIARLIRVAVSEYIAREEAK